MGISILLIYSPFFLFPFLFLFLFLCSVLFCLFRGMLRGSNN